jgi:TonB-linked SusC/RagA family outer membrane protein
MQLTAHGNGPVCSEPGKSVHSIWRIMKLTAAFLLLATLQLSARTMGQTMTASFKNSSLVEVFKEVEKQTGYSFVFSSTQIQRAGKVTASFNNIPLVQVLTQIFKDQPLDFQVSGKFIVVQEKSTPKAGILLQNALPPGTVKGKVTDEAGKPVAGATVTIKGSSRFTMTNEQGEFTLDNVADLAVLVISSVQIETSEVALKGRKDITLVAKPKIYALEEVNVGVVNNGYQTISKERTTGAYDVVTAKDLQKVPSNDLLERLEGKVPGVRIDVRSGTLQIRTVNTYSTTSQPLIVIDGFPLQPRGDEQKLTTRGTSVMSNGSVLSSFNANDIEQITFLKDAVATSIWGAKGSNGVIVIETKKGRRNAAATINMSATLGVSKAPAIADLDWMTTAEYVDLEKEMLAKNFLVDATVQPGYSSNRYQTPNPSDVQEWYFKVKRGTATQAQADAAIAAIAQRSNYDQIQQYMLRSAVNQQYNLSISGGGENNTYYLSGNYNKDLPIYKSNSAQNAFITGNFTNDLFNKLIKLRMGFNYQGSVAWSNQAATDALSQFGQGLRPYDMLVDAQGNPIRRSIVMRPEVNNELVGKGYLPFTYNAIDEMNYSKTKTATQQIRLNAGLTFRLTNWANLDLSGMYQRLNSNLTGIDEANSYAGRILINTYTTLNPSTNKQVYNLPFGGRYLTTDGNGFDYNFRGVLNVNRSFGSDHQLTALAGGEIRQTYTKSSSVTRYGYDADANSFAAVNPTVSIPTMYGWSQSIGNNVSGISENKNRYLSYFTNAAYTYKSRYVLSASARFDDYTLLGVERSKRAKPFWSAGARWSMKDESFLQHVQWINGLNVRATYGTAGAVPLAGTNIPLLSLGFTDPSTQLPIGTISTAANRDLGWELTKTLNFGADIQVLNNRLGLSVDAYTKRSNGILVSQPFNGTYGWTTISFNSGTMSSHGIEFSLTGKPVDKKDWGITSVLNFAYGNTKVTDNRYKITAASSLVNGSTIVQDYPTGATFVYRSAGLDGKGQTQIYDRSNKIINSTTNLTTAFDINDLKYAGVKVAPYYGGFFNTFRYKSFSLDVQTTYYLGHIFQKPTTSNYPNFPGTYSGTLGRQRDLARRWKQPGDEAFTDVPGLSDVNFNSISRYRLSDNQVRKADNVRLQQVSIAYAVPQKWLPKRVIRAASVSASARNLGIIWRANKDGIDPEYLNPSANYYTLPPVTSYVFNINLTF